MAAFKLGRRPPKHLRLDLRAAAALHASLAPLGVPPAASNDYVSAVARQAPNGWGMYLNDELGDCTIADSAHQVMLHSANGGAIVIPTDDQVKAMYEVVGGYVPGDESTDQGCVESDVIAYLQSTGLTGQKVAGTAPVDPTNLDYLRWTVQIFGACRLGITVTDAMMDAFSAGQPWETFGGNVDGGHDVPIVKYDADYAYVVTWPGNTMRLQPVAWSLLADQRFLEEAHAEVWPDFVRAGGTAPSGFDLAGLLASLPQVGMSS